MAVQTINTNTNIDDVASGTWLPGDTFTINNGAVLTINTTQSKYIAGITINQGKLVIRNTGPDFMRVPLGRASGTTIPAIVASNGLCDIEVLGEWLTLGTGNGTVSQSLTLPTTDYIPAVWVNGEIWTNCLTGMTPEVDHTHNGFKGVGTGVKGKVFRQTPVSDPYAACRLVITGCSSTSGSPLLSMGSTAGLYTGAHVTTSVGFPANVVISEIVSATQVRLSGNATSTNDSTITATIFNPERSQYTNQIVFGDGINGNILPDGAVVQIPNLVLTCDAGANLTTNGYPAAREVNLNLSAGGNMVADKAIIHYRNSSLGGAQKLHMSYVATAGYNIYSRIYDLILDNLAVGSSPLTVGAVGGARFRVAADIGQLMVVEYCAGSITNLVISDSIKGSSSLVPSGILRVLYSSGIYVNNVRVHNISEGVSVGGMPAIGIGYTDKATLTNFELYGFTGPLQMYASNGNNLDGWQWSLSGSANHISNGITGNTYYSNFLPDGTYMQPGTTYYIRTGLKWGNQEGQTWYSPELSVTPFLGSWLRLITKQILSATSVKFDWTKTLPLNTGTVYELYRSTDPLVPVRDASTRVFTTSNVATLTYTDTGLSTGTTYYYVFRKYETSVLFYDTPPQEVTPSADFIPTSLSSLAIYGSAVSTGTAWIESGVSQDNSTPAAPYFSTAGSHAPVITGASITRKVFSSPASTLTLSRSGLAIGTTYTFSGVIRAGNLLTVGQPIKTTTPIRIIFGTATQNLTLTGAWQRFDMTFVATATTHTLQFTNVDAGMSVDFGPLHLLLGNYPGLPIFAHAGANPVTVSFRPDTVGIEGYRQHPGQTEACIRIVNSASANVPGVFNTVTHISTTKGFTPTLSNLTHTVASAGNGISVSVSSNRNTISNITQLGIGATLTEAIYLFNSCSDNTFTNVVFREGADRTTSSGSRYKIYLEADCNRNIFRRLKFGHSSGAANTTQQLFRARNDCIDNVFQNIETESPSVFVETQNIGNIVKGVTGGSGTPGDSRSVALLGTPWDGTINTTLTAVYDTHCAELDFKSDSGALVLLFTASTKAVPPYTVAGSAGFSNTGALYLINAGDSYTYTWPHRIYGVSGFKNIAHVTQHADMGPIADLMTAALLLEYRIDTGGGWSTWEEATPSNLSARVVDANLGFYISFRLTARPFIRYSSLSNPYVIGETIRAASGGTAVVEAVSIHGTAGVVALSSVTGTWTSGTSVVRDSDSQARSNTVNTNGFVLGPSFNSLIRAIQVHVNRDPLALYPLPKLAGLTITGIISGTDIVILENNSDVVIQQINENPSSVYIYEYDSPHTVDVGLFKAGYKPLYIRGLELTASSSSIPVSQAVDRDYTNPI